MRITEILKIKGITFVLLPLCILAGCNETAGKAPEAPRQEITDRQKEKNKYAILYFWEGFDFSDTCCIYRPDMTEQAFADYINLLGKATDTAVISRSVHAMLSRAQRQDKTAKVYAYLLELYSHYLYEPNSPMRNDEMYIPVLEYILENETTQALQKQRARFNLDMVLRNRPGTPAANLRFITSWGREMELYGIESPLLLLYFYNPDCTACKETTAYLENAEYIGRLQQDGQLTVVALYTDRDMLLWKKDRSIPPGWIKAYDNDMQVTRKRLYDLRAIPSLYLLDKDKEVLLKDTDITGLEEFLCHK